MSIIYENIIVVDNIIDIGNDENSELEDNVKTNVGYVFLLGMIYHIFPTFLCSQHHPVIKIVQIHQVMTTVLIQLVMTTLQMNLWPSYIGHFYLEEKEVYSLR